MPVVRIKQTFTLLVGSIVSYCLDFILTIIIAFSFQNRGFLPRVPEVCYIVGTCFQSHESNNSVNTGCFLRLFLCSS